MFIDQIDTESAVRIFGEDNQKKQTIGKIGELMAAMNQHRIGRVERRVVQEEIADVMIMMEQLAHIYGYYDVELIVKSKMKHLNNCRAEEAWRQRDKRMAKYKAMEKSNAIGL